MSGEPGDLLCLRLGGLAGEEALVGEVEGLADGQGDLLRLGEGQARQEVPGAAVPSTG